MKFIFGLGNPGIKYQDTRHNIGFDILDILAKQWETGSKFVNNKKLNSEIIKNKNLILTKPQTFMNDSGQAVRAVLNYYDKINFTKNT
ncbi:unnamed protein product [marine sediment metagenome]|uniref:peptidyl-tRNA hydrolase n=1 Tax=marine sediment metagenome TaxID=412755 RepID=X1DSP2_9ZZZZ